MQEPANMPDEVTCHVDARKHESIVYQFQSMEILQVLLLPIDIPLISIDAAVDVAAVPVAVAVAVDDMSMDIVMVILDISILFIVFRNCKRDGEMRKLEF